jgi:hypothetical protein
VVSLGLRELYDEVLTESAQLPDKTVRASETNDAGREEVVLVVPRCAEFVQLKLPST